jgi:hypothetical protein
MYSWAIGMLANQKLLHRLREGLVRNFEHPGSRDAKRIRFVVIDCLNEDRQVRIGSMKLRTGDRDENRSRFVDTPDIMGNRAGSGGKRKV